MTAKKRLSVDFSWLGPTGIGRVAEEVMNRCPSEWEVIPMRNDCKNATPLTPLHLAFSIARSRADVFWSPGFIPPAWKADISVAITIHDLTHLHFYKKYHRYYYDFAIRPCLKHVDKIITVSEFSKAELLTWAHESDDRVLCIHNGVSADFQPIGEISKIGSKYILYVGNRRSYKNVKSLIYAFAASDLWREGFVLALTGDRDASCLQAERDLGLEGRLHYLGFVPEESLAALYRGAHALAFVSLYEGFGLPVIEAMACGVPVLTSNVSSLPEVAGNAAHLVNPNDVQDISNGLRRVALDMDLRNDLIRKGLARAGDFSWDITAAAYWKTFDSLVSQRKG